MNINPKYEVYETNETEHEHDFYDGVCCTCGWDLREAKDFIND